MMEVEEQKKIAEEKKEMLKAEERKSIESPEARLKDLEEQLQRLQAEFENYKKRSDREKDGLSGMVIGAFLKRLLPVVDEFEIALSHANKAKKEELRNGMEMLYKNLMAVLMKEGLSEMKVADNEMFDPYKHDAIRGEESDVEEGRIISVVKKGYYFRDAVLRHANVIVSRGRKKGE